MSLVRVNDLIFNLDAVTVIKRCYRNSTTTILKIWFNDGDMDPITVRDDEADWLWDYLCMNGSEVLKLTPE